MLLMVLLSLAAMGTLIAQQAENAWKPSLGEAFPLGVKDGRVVLTEAVLVNSLQVLPAGSLARNIFMTPDTKAVEKANKKKKKNEFEERYATNRPAISAIDPEADPRDNFERAVDQLASGEAWTQVEKFAAFFHIAPSDAYLFAYQSSAEAPPSVVQFRLPEKLLLTEAGGKVMVRSVGVGSAAERSGLPAGAELVRVGETDLEGTLRKFITAYPKEKEKAQLAGRPLALTYRTAESPEPKVAELRVPLSLKSNAGLFDDIPLDSKPAPKTEQPQVETAPGMAP